MRDLGSLYFLIRHTFVCATFVSGNKAQLALFPETKLHIQKCNTCRDIQCREPIAEFAIAQWYSSATFYRPETTLAAADSAKAASPTPDITLSAYSVSKLHAMSSREYIRDP
jgi:hypothetical protein